MKRSYLLSTLSVLLLIVSALACGGNGTDVPDATAPPAAGLAIKTATFAHGLDDDGGPVDPGDEFAPDETVYLSLVVEGRPKEGVVSAQFYYHDDSIAEAEIDLAEVNEGVIFSIGEDTYVNFWLTPEGTLAIGQVYRVDVAYDGEPVDSYSFRVVPPDDAIPSAIREATLARGVDDAYNPVGPATSFAPGDTVYLVARGDIGMYTWLEVQWIVDGSLDEEGTNSLTAEENKTDAGFFFSYMPEGGWPEGEHQAVLVMDDEEVGRYDFTVGEMALVPYEDPDGIFAISHPPDFDSVDRELDQSGHTTTFDAPGDSSIIYVFFGDLGQAVGDEQWANFARDYTLVGMPGFGSDTVELDRKQGEPGTHVIVLEVESKETDVHGLAWVEEVDGVMTVAVLLAPIDEWPAREAELRAALDSFTWSPQAARVVLGG